MASIVMHGHNMKLLTFGSEVERRVEHEDIEVSVMAMVDNLEMGGEDFPSLHFCVSQADIGSTSSDRAIFIIGGVEEIDLLRRYCEMTLEHFKQGSLS